MDASSKVAHWPKKAVGWLDLIVKVQLPLTSPLSLSSCLERERERAWYTHFFLVSTLPREQSSAEVSWQVVKHAFDFYVYHL